MGVIHDALEKHRILWLSILGGIVLLLLTWKIVAHLDNRAHDEFVIAQAKVEADKKAQAAADAQADKDRKQFDELKQQLDRQNQQLRSQIDGLQKQLSERQANDATLAPSDLAARHRELIGASKDSDVQPSSNGYLVGQLAELTTVQHLEALVPLQNQNRDLSGIIANKDSQISGMEKLAKDSDAQLAACKETQKASDIAHSAEVKEIKAKARKSKIKVFLGGIATGAALVARILI
jgi:F0F1-type ATP synthase membrane subunit b/b'